MPLFSVNTWLIVICCAVFFIDPILARTIGIYRIMFPDGQMTYMKPLEWFGHFSATLAIYHVQIWRFITFQFLHANLMHLLFNMFALWMFGPLIESYLGRTRYLAFYLLCGIAGAVSYLILWRLHILVTDPWIPLIGASAGIFGVLIAGARIAPNIEVLVMGIIPMSLRTMAWALIAIAVYTVFTSGTNAGGEAAHLGGAALGYVLITYPKILDIFDSGFGSRRRMIL